MSSQRLAPPLLIALVLFILDPATGYWHGALGLSCLVLAAKDHRSIPSLRALAVDTTTLLFLVWAFGASVITQPLEMVELAVLLALLSRQQLEKADMSAFELMKAGTLS